MCVCQCEVCLSKKTKKFFYSKEPEEYKRQYGFRVKEREKEVKKK